MSVRPFILREWYIYHSLKMNGHMAAMLKDRQWVEITGTIKKEYYREFRGDGPVIYATKVVPAEKPKEEVVLFN